MTKPSQCCDCTVGYYNHYTKLFLRPTSNVVVTNTKGKQNRRRKKVDGGNKRETR